MSKKPIRRPTPDRASSVDLRRWCIECAISWPTYAHPHGSYGAQQASINQLYQPPPSMVDHDVIARAEKIMHWVTK